LSLAFKNILRE
jgi:hypothetical protein